MANRINANTGGTENVPPAILLNHIYKSFGAVQANRDIHLDVALEPFTALSARMGLANQRWYLFYTGFIPPIRARLKYLASR